MRELDLPGIAKLCSGKVREILAAGDDLLIVATDRISAFDVVLPDPIPQKGAVLNQLSAHWLSATESIVDNHLISADFDDFPSHMKDFQDQLRGRSMLVRKCRPLPFECIVRGYLAGSGWKDYQASGSISGVALPSGLIESQQLPEPIFTPSTKAQVGQHDENVPFEAVVRELGGELAQRLRQVSLDIYAMASRAARERGIIICDTKFEFGLDASDRLLLIDEVLTPDSSRFWPADRYQPGAAQPSFDKQFVRDYLETLDWNKKPPAPSLPGRIVQATSERYLEAFRRISGRELELTRPTVRSPGPAA